MCCSNRCESLKVVAFTILEVTSEIMVRLLSFCMFKPSSDLTDRSKAVLLCGFFLFYPSPLILTELFQINLINVSYLTACYLYQVMMTLHSLNDVAYDAESTHKKRTS